MTLAAWLAGCVALLIATQPARAADGSPAVPEAAIRAENARWAEAYARGDAAAIGARYTDDAELLPPGEARVRGRAAITAYFGRRGPGASPRTIRFVDAECFGDGATVTEISDTEIRDGDGSLVGRGRQMLVFVRQGTAWKLHRDIWNAAPPAP